MRSSAAKAIGHSLAIVLVYTLLFSWLFARLIITDAYLAESDLFDWFLPLFLSPIAQWSSAIFAGLPSFADTSDAAQYPVQFFFARIVGSWNGYVIAAYVLAASLTYAYVLRITASRAAAWIAGLAFGLSEAMVERQAHINFVHAFAWLPLILLSIERLLAGAPARWVAIGAFALACCFLSGHPQPLLYAGTVCVAYSITGAIAERTPAATRKRLAAMFLLGGALSAIKALPFLEATRLVSRTTVGYGQFVSQSHTPAQMLGVLFPSIEHNGREAPLYVGIAILMLAVVGAVSAWRNWRVRLWLAVALLALLVAAGDNTFVARLMYQLPLFDKFRVSARMLFLFAFGMATLAGFGLDALTRRAIPPVVVRWSVALVLGGVIAGAAALLGPLDVTFESRTLPWPLPLWNGGVWVQLGIAATAAALLLWMARTRRMGTAIAMLTVLVFGDLLYSLPYAVSWTGIAPVTVRARDLQPSVHAVALAREIAPDRQRVLSVGGTTRDAIVPAGFARLWNVPIAGGYSPIVLARLAQMAEMGGNGDIRPRRLALEDRALDLLSTRYAIVRDDDFPQPATFERDGITWNEAALGVSIGPEECGHRYRRTMTLPLPDDVTVSAIAVVAYMRCAEDVPHGTEAAAIDVVAQDGTPVQRMPLVAGVNLADRSLADPSVRSRARHGPATLFDDPSLPPNAYFLRMDLPRPLRGGRMIVEGAPTGGWTTIERLTLIDEAGRSTPQDVGPLLLGNRERWELVRRVRTSRVTDRVADEDAAGERGFAIYENHRALPRAWIAGDVIELTDRETLQAIRYSQLPDGRPFDPARQAIVAPGGGARRFEEGQNAARVTSISDGEIVVEVSTETGGYLVLSEMYYPGWRASIDGSPVEIHRTNLALQGVTVPPGQHTARFELESTTLRAGAGISLVALGCSLFLVWRR